MSRSHALLSLIVLACAWAGARPAQANPADQITRATAGAPRGRVVQPAANALVVYLHGDGGRLVAAGRDDARNFRSNVVKHAGLPHADVPAFEGSPDEWRQVLACVRRYYVGLPVEVVDERPTAGDYLMLVVGGRATDLGYQKLWGLSSNRKQRVVDRGVGFVFSAAHPSNPSRVQRLCETTSHELGHLLGLPHTDSCDDLMTSNNTCVRKAPIYGFKPENRTGLARAIDRWRTNGHAGADPQTVIAQPPTDAR